LERDKNINKGLGTCAREEFTSNYRRLFNHEILLLHGLVSLSSLHSLREGFSKKGFKLSLSVFIAEVYSLKYLRASNNGILVAALGESLSRGLIFAKSTKSQCSN
jgi:hypothetical protein